MRQAYIVPAAADDFTTSHRKTSILFAELWLNWRAGDYVKILKSADAPGFCWSLGMALSLALRVISCIIVRRDE